MSVNALSISIRTGTGKGGARKLRMAGRIPGICYGKHEAAVAVSLDPHQLGQLLSRSEAGMNTLFQLQVDGGGALDGKSVLVRDLQKDPVRGRFLHVDLYAVDLTQLVTVSVPIHIRGKAKGVDLGGVLDQALRELEIECRPDAIPNEITVDVSELEVGMSLHVRDLVLPEGVALVSDPDLSLVSVVLPTKEEAAPAAAAVAAETPAAGAAPAEAANNKTD